MKKLFIFLGWFIVSTVITVGAYILVFFMKPSIPIAGLVAGGVILIIMVVLISHIEDNTNKIPFLTCITTCFIFSGLESLLKQSSVGFVSFGGGIIMLISSILLFIILASSIKTTFEIETNLSYLKVTGLFVVLLTLVQAVIIAGTIYYISY